MKKLTYLGILMTLLLGSCDEDAANRPNNALNVSGDYVLTSVVADVAVDLDDDAAVDTELFNETDCFDNWDVSFTANGDFVATAAAAEFDANNDLICNTINADGTYTFDTASSVLTATINVNGGTVTESQPVAFTATTFSFTVTDQDVSQYFTNDPGTPVSDITQLQFTYTKI